MSDQVKRHPVHQWWITLYEEHRVAWVALFTAWMVASGLLIAVVFGARPSLGATERMCTHNPDGTCAVSPTRAARLFRHDHYTRADGVSWKRLTTHPRAVRAAFRHKFAVYYMHASAAKKKAIRERYGLHFSTARDIHNCSFGWGMAKCAAENMLQSLNHISCQSTNDYVTPQDDQCVTVTGILGLHHGNGFTKTEVQNTGTVSFCAGNALLGVKAASSSESGPGVLFMALWGTSSCGFAAWVAWDS